MSLNSNFIMSGNFNESLESIVSSSSTLFKGIPTLFFTTYKIRHCFNLKGIISNKFMQSVFLFETVPFNLKWYLAYLPGLFKTVATPLRGNRGA